MMTYFQRLQTRHHRLLSLQAHRQLRIVERESQLVLKR